MRRIRDVTFELQGFAGSNYIYTAIYGKVTRAQASILRKGSSHLVTDEADRRSVGIPPRARNEQYTLDRIFELMFDR